MKYRIRDWERRFETTRSRAMTNCRFVSVPLMLADRGYMRLMQGADGAACFGVYVALAVWQMSRFDGGTRDGWLTDDGTPDGQALTADDLAVELRMDELTVSVALDELSDVRVGLLEAHPGGGEEGREGDYRGREGRRGGNEDETYGRGGRREEDAGAGARGRGTRGGADEGPAAPAHPAAAGRSRPPRVGADGDGRTTEPPETAPAPAGTPGAAPQDGGGRTDGRGARAEGADGRTADDGETGAGRVAPLTSGGERNRPPSPPPLFPQGSFAAAASVEVPCQDGVWQASETVLGVWARAFPQIDLAAELLRMAAWNMGKLEAGGAEFYKAWRTGDAAARAEAWLAEEGGKAASRAKAGEAAAAPRGAAGKPAGDWRREIEALDKLARGKRRRANDLRETLKLDSDDWDARQAARRRHPQAAEELARLEGELLELTREMAGVKRGGGK